MIATQRDTLNVLEARIADLEAENLDLRRRMSALEHDRETLGRKHERAANRIEALEKQVGLLILLAQSNVMLLP